MVLSATLTESHSILNALSLELGSFHSYLVLSTSRAGVERSAKALKANRQECWELVLRMVETVLDNVAVPLREVEMETLGSVLSSANCAIFATYSFEIPCQQRGRTATS